MCFLSCVEEIEFDGNEEIGTLVVDAQLSTAADSNLIFLSRTSPINKQVFPIEVGAKITLFDDIGNREDFHDLGQGKYHLAGEQMNIKIGRSFYIEIITQNGQKYISDPEVVIPAPSIDSLTFDFSIEEIVERENQVLERSFFNLSVNGEIPETNLNTFLKWDVEHVYQVAEIVCSPLVAPKTCYVSRDVNLNRVTLLNGKDYSIGASYRIPVIHQELDYAFGLVASFYVSQQSLSQTAFDYWERVNQILASGGSIFETPPAAIIGNVHCTTESDEEVLGYFSVVDEQREVILITRGDLVDPFNELPLCGLNGNLPADIDFRICCNCLGIENSTRMRPSYWP